MPAPASPNISGKIKPLSLTQLVPSKLAGEVGRLGRLGRYELAPFYDEREENMQVRITTLAEKTVYRCSLYSSAAGKPGRPVHHDPGTGLDNGEYDNDRRSRYRNRF